MWHALRRAEVSPKPVRPIPALLGPMWEGRRIYNLAWPMIREVAVGSADCKESYFAARGWWNVPVPTGTGFRLLGLNLELRLSAMKGAASTATCNNRASGIGAEWPTHPLIFPTTCSRETSNDGVRHRCVRNNRRSKTCEFIGSGAMDVTNQY